MANIQRRRDDGNVRAVIVTPSRAKLLSQVGPHRFLVLVGAMAARGSSEAVIGSTHAQTSGGGDEYSAPFESFAEITAEMAQEGVTVHRGEAPWPRKAHLTLGLEGKDASFLEIGRH